MSVRTKLLIPLILFTVFIVGLVFSFEGANRNIQSHQKDLLVTNDFFDNVLAVRVELDQYLLTDSRKDRIDYEQETKALLLEADSLRRELSFSRELVSDVSESVENYLEELDYFLEINIDIDSTLLLINNTGDELSNAILVLSEELKSQDSLFIYSDDSPRDFNEYKDARSQTYQLLEEIVKLRSDIREFIITQDTSFYNSVAENGKNIENRIQEANSNTYLDLDLPLFISRLSSLLSTSEDYLKFLEEYEKTSLYLDTIQRNLEAELSLITTNVNQRLSETVENQRKVSYIIYSLSAILLLIMIFQLIVVFSKPLNKLKGAILSIANNESNLDEFKIESKDEFGEISDTLHAMLKKIEIKEDQLTEVNQKLSVSNKELEAFAYSVSHDLRTPLRSISGFSEALLSNHEEQLDETGKHYLKRVSKASQKMGLLIDDILKLSRISRTTIEKTKIDISELSKSIFEDVIEEVDAVPELQVKEHIIVNADRGLTKVLLFNLIGNAVKFTSKEANPKIEVTAVKKEGEEFICVRDNGIGFKMKYANKLFQPFQRLHPDSEFEGTGIGLATVKRIINKHNGKVFVESELNVGTTFYFNFGGI